MSWRVNRGVKRGVMGLLLLAALWQLGAGSYIQAKAWLAQVLLERAWQSTLQGQSDVKPWPWADTSPVGKLILERTGENFIVLEGASGRNLAFGPTWDPAGSAVGTSGVALLAAHRDTHFRGLRHLKLEDRLGFQSPQGHQYWFRIRHMEVVDARRTAIAREIGTAGTSRLVLVTCFPFDDWVPGGPLRYLVIAELEKGSEVTQLAAATDSL